jgi:hypothetical protein
VPLMSFVPGGQAGDESIRMTREAELHEAELHARQRSEVQDSERPKRLSVIKRILRALRRTQ